MTNGKGDSPRPFNGAQFRSNWDAIDWHRGPKPGCTRCGKITKYPQHTPTFGELCFKCY
jgi:hypothetical protein